MIQALCCWGSAPQGCHSDAIACLTSVASFLDVVQADLKDKRLTVHAR